MPYTIELQGVLDGNYWIRIIDEGTGKRHGPLLGPFNRERVFNYLLRAGVHDDGKPDQLISEAALNGKAKIIGIEQEPPSD